MSNIDINVAPTSAILDGIYPMVNKSFSNGRIPKYKACVGRYMTARAKEIHDTVPCDRIYFRADEKNDFFNSIGISEKLVQEELKKTYYWNIDFRPKSAKDPFSVTMMMVIRYFSIHKMPKEAELSGIYLAFSGMFYASVHSEFFRDFPPSEYREIMDYVVNFKLNNKFDIKREGTVFKAVKKAVISWIAAYEDRLKNPGGDDDVAYLLMQLRDRIKSLMKNLSKVYFEAYKNKEALMYGSDNVSDEEGGAYVLSDNDALMASRFTENTMNYLTNSSINYRFCKMCADSNVRADEIRDIVQSIIHDVNYMTQIKDVINVLITNYMENIDQADKHNITGVRFLSYSIKAKPNTKDKDVMRMKSTIESWLDENSPNYRRRKSREATKNSYYKAILEYIVLSINEANK